MHGSLAAPTASVCRLLLQWLRSAVVEHGPQKALCRTASSLLVSPRTPPPPYWSRYAIRFGGHPQRACCLSLESYKGRLSYGKTMAVPGCRPECQHSGVAYSICGIVA